jgi:hypothetical protein
MQIQILCVVKINLHSPSKDLNNLLVCAVFS